MVHSFMTGAKEMSALRKLNLIFRFSYTLPFFLASLCGVVFAYIHTDVPWYIAILIPVTVMFLAVFVNFSNDYYDHVSGVDDLRFNNKDKGMLDGVTDSMMMKKLYWDGNPVNNGLVTREQAKMIMLFLVIISVILSIPILLYGGWLAVLFGAIGLLIAFFYTAPPVNLGARGLGEIAVAVSFFLMVFASYYIASEGIWNTEILVFAIMIGVLVGLMRLVDSMSGQEAHIAAGEKSISVMLGLDGMVPVIKAVQVVAYIIVAVMVLFFDITYVLLFLTLPIAIKGWKILKEKKQYWEVMMAPVTFVIAFLTELLFIIIQVIQIYFTYNLF